MQTIPKFNSEEEIHMEESVDFISENFDIEAYHQQRDFAHHPDRTRSKQGLVIFLKSVIIGPFGVSGSGITLYHFQDKT